MKGSDKEERYSGWGSNCSGIDGEKSLTVALGGRVVDRMLELNS